MWLGKVEIKGIKVKGDGLVEFRVVGLRQGLIRGDSLLASCSDKVVRRADKGSDVEVRLVGDLLQDGRTAWCVRESFEVMTAHDDGSVQVSWTVWLHVSVDLGKNSETLAADVRLLDRLLCGGQLQGEMQIEKI